VWAGDKSECDVGNQQRLARIECRRRQDGCAGEYQENRVKYGIAAQGWTLSIFVVVGGRQL